MDFDALYGESDTFAGFTEAGGASAFERRVGLALAAPDHPLVMKLRAELGAIEATRVWKLIAQLRRMRNGIRRLWKVRD